MDIIVNKGGSVPANKWITWFFRTIKVPGMVSSDYLGRDVIVTPYEGAYGVAGYVVAINGSPPKGVAFVQTSSMQLWLVNPWRDRVVRGQGHSNSSSHQRYAEAVVLLADLGVPSPIHQSCV